MVKDKKFKTEAEMRKGLLAIGKALNCQQDVEQIFQKYDKMLKHCTNPDERYLIGLSGVKELHLFLQCKGALVVNGEVILPPEKNFTIWSA
jgi:hypothetical protein